MSGPAPTMWIPWKLENRMMTHAIFLFIYGCSMSRTVKKKIVLQRQRRRQQRWQQQQRWWRREGPHSASWCKRAASQKRRRTRIFAHLPSLLWPYVIPYLTLPYLNSPYTLCHTLPYALPYLTPVIPYLTLPQLTFCITLPYALRHTFYLTYLTSDAKSRGLVTVPVLQMYYHRNTDTDNRTLKDTYR